MRDIINEAFEIALKAHEDQIDKAGQPYINHPIHVAVGVESDEEKAVALLHDVVEDSSVSLDDLRAQGLPEAVVEAVGAMTKREGEDYEGYLMRVKSNPIARVVKIADMEHNSDLSRIPNPTAKDWARVDKYKKGLELLHR